MLWFLKDSFPTNFTYPYNLIPELIPGFKWIVQNMVETQWFIDKILLGQDNDRSIVLTLGNPLTASFKH